MNPVLTLVETWEEAEEFRSWLGQSREWLAVDTETTGLEYWTPHFVRLVQFGDAERAWALPYWWWGRLIKDSLERYTGKIAMHNAKFDLHALESVGIQVNEANVHDTAIMAWLVNPLGPIGLKPLSNKRIDAEASAGQQRLHDGMRKFKWTWATVPIEFEPYWQYAALDCIWTAILAADLYAEMRTANLLDAYEMECAVTLVLKRAESRGARLDIPYTSALRDKWNIERNQHARILHAAGIGNPNAAVQIAAALQARGWEPDEDEYTPSGKVSVAETVLKGLDDEIAQSVVEYRRLTKWTSTYLDTFLQRADGELLHADIRPLRARTGRMSITKPALQTLPRGPEIRNCIIPSEGNRLLAVDYSNIELRLLAHFAQERPMMEAFKAGVDIHGSTAEGLYGPGFTAEQRSICKNGNFSKVFGAGPAKFSETAKVTLEEAQAFMDSWNKTYPRVTQFMREVEQAGRIRLSQENISYVRTPYGHRLLSDPDKLYTLVNYLMQGTAAGVLKKTILNLDAAGLTDTLVLPVHDELIFDIPDEDFDLTRKEIIETMEVYDQFTVPLTVGASDALDRWGANAK